MRKIKLNLRIAVFFFVIILFAHFFTYYYIQNENDKLLELISTRNAALLEQLNSYEEKISAYEKRLDENEESLNAYKNTLDIYKDLIYELKQKDNDIEGVVTDIVQKINELSERYESSSYSDVQTDNKTKPDNVQNNSQNNQDIYNLYYGRLYIPSVKINVALYNGWQQHITDRVDSANIFKWSDCKGYTIADHSSQEFSKLFNVNVGTNGYIKLKDGSVINIECVEIFNGYNTGSYIVDSNGVNAANRTDYMMYTCLYGQAGILICLWEII